MYQRGYWEDTDLAMAVSSIGYRVQYQPLAVVVHDEGGSLSTEKQALMLANQQIFIRTWRSTLESHFCTSNLPLDTAALRLEGTKRLLWIDDIVPEPDKDSGSVRTNNIVAILKRMGYAVSYQAITPRNEAYIAQARFRGIQVSAYDSCCSPCSELIDRKHLRACILECMPNQCAESFSCIQLQVCRLCAVLMSVRRLSLPSLHAWHEDWH